MKRPLVQRSSLSLLGAWAQHKQYLHQMDVSTAFLLGELSVEVYMRHPEGFVESGQETLCAV